MIFLVAVRKVIAFFVVIVYTAIGYQTIRYTKEHSPLDRADKRFIFAILLIVAYFLVSGVIGILR